MEYHSYCRLRVLEPWLDLIRLNFEMLSSKVISMGFKVLCWVHHLGFLWKVGF